MNKYGMPCIISLFCLLLWLAPSVAAGRIQKFQAEQVHLDPAGQIRATSRIYSMPDKLRLEMNHPSGKGSMIMIFRRPLSLNRPALPRKYRLIPECRTGLKKS
jgi:hypothetical protein